MFNRSSRTSLATLAAAAALVTGCRWLDLMGLAHPEGTPPDEPGIETPWGWPVLVLAMRDTLLTVGDTETLMGELYVSPVTRYSKPYGVYDDSSRKVAVTDSNIVSANGIVITARTPGRTPLKMYGFSGVIPISAAAYVRVVPKP